MNLADALTEPATVDALNALATHPGLVEAEAPVAAQGLLSTGVNLPRAWRRRYKVVAEAQAVAREIRAQIRSLAAHA